MSKNLAEEPDLNPKPPKLHIGNNKIHKINKTKKMFRTVSWSLVTVEEQQKGSGFEPKTNKLLKHLSKGNLKDLKNITMSKKDRMAMKLLVFLSIEFCFTNIPMAVVKIAMAFGYSDEPVFHEFVVFSIILEITFAASNFYLYCLCNSQVRKKVQRPSFLQKKLFS